MKFATRTSLVLSLAASLAAGTAFAQAPATAPAPAQAPAKAAAPAPATTAPAAVKVGDDILETAAKAGNFKTLAKALEAADLIKVLKDPKKAPFTVFAPNDAAFAKLSKEQLDALLKPENKRLLVSALGAHVLTGKALKASRIVEAKSFHVSMSNGSLVVVDGRDAKAVKFGGGLVTKADIETSNGVIHEVDTVYMPKRVRAAMFAIDKAAKAKAAAGPAYERAKEAGAKALEKGKELGGKALEATKDAAGKAVDKAKEATGNAPAPAPK